VQAITKVIENYHKLLFYKRESLRWNIIILSFVQGTRNHKVFLSSALQNYKIVYYINERRRRFNNSY